MAKTATLHEAAFYKYFRNADPALLEKKENPYSGEIKNDDKGFRGFQIPRSLVTAKRSLISMSICAGPNTR